MSRDPLSSAKCTHVRTLSHPQRLDNRFISFDCSRSNHHPQPSLSQLCTTEDFTSDEVRAMIVGLVQSLPVDSYLLWVIPEIQHRRWTEGLAGFGAAQCYLLVRLTQGGGGEG